MEPPPAAPVWVNAGVMSVEPSNFAVKTTLRPLTFQPTELYLYLKINFAFETRISKRLNFYELGMPLFPTFILKYVLE